MLWLVPAAAALVIAGPVLAGLAFTVLPAFDIIPALGRTRPSLAGWAMLLQKPGFGTALRLTVVSGGLATVLSFGLAVAFCALALTRPGWRWTRVLQGPILASPHSAVALGLAFLIAPSGWLVRLLSPWATGWQAPPAGLVTLRDPWGLALAAGLILKETPYLVVMIVAATGQVPCGPLLATAGALGQRPAAAWLKTVFPLVYRQIRLPILAVAAFSLSVVDIALVLAPGIPPPLAVLAVRWLTNYDLTLYGPAAAGAVLVLLIVCAAAALWWAAERPVAWLARVWIERGGPARVTGALLAAGALVAGAAGAAAVAGAAGLALWSIAGAWRFPEALPTGLTGTTWAAQTPRALAAAVTTALLGAGVVGVALALALGGLEHRQRRGAGGWHRADGLLFAPLLVPQVAFLFGVQVVLVRLGLDGTLLAVAWVHLVFVLPYVVLSLAEPFLALDPRYAAAAAALGASPARIFVTVKLPLLVRPILLAAAVGFAVSVAQYLPTLFAGAGRITTVTTEAVTLASGADRRVVGVFAVLQAALPLGAYGLAFALPSLLARRRRGLAR